MKKILEFFKTNILIVEWTIGYFFMLWFILKFIFNFDMFSARYWWKFFHATLHGFGGFVFGALVYTALPIYIATVITIYRKKEPIIKIPLFNKISSFISLLFSKKQEPVAEEESEEQPIEENEEKKAEYPDGLPAELRVPFQRAKNHLSLTGAVSVYNKQTTQPLPSTPEQIMENAEDNMPLPVDFDISDKLDATDDAIPTFTDINFDEPVKEEKLENNTTKYLESKNIEYETYKNFVATDKYVIYEHNDNDFWIMDDDAWFAAGKQMENPTHELIDIAKQNGLIPVLYLQSQNIMDIESAIDNFESAGIRVVKSLDELN